MLKLVFSACAGRRMAGWKKIVALAAVLGLAVIIWMYINQSRVDEPDKEKTLERDKMGSEESDEVYVDEAAALEHERAIKVAKIAKARSNSKVNITPKKTKHTGRGNEKEVNETGKKVVPGPGLISAETNHKVEGKNLSVLGHRRDMLFLPAGVIDRVKTLVSFIGYQRSGHSIIGSFMDAHPHMIIAHEFMLFTKWKEMEERYKSTGVMNPLRTKEILFNELYRDSYMDAEHGWRSGQLKNKNYTLTIDSQWQGRYDRDISVLGDKSGAATTSVFTSSSQKFKQYLDQMKETVGIPIKFLHVVRNPYDMIATDALYSEGKRRRVRTGVKQALFVSNFKRNFSESHTTGKLETFKAERLNNETLLESRLKSVTRLANGNRDIIRLIGEENVLELHNIDLVRDPMSTLNKICEFLKIDCSHKYLQTCADKVFKTVSSTRELVVWPSSTRRKVEELIRQHTFFQRYSFEKE